jgi:hypothetical protein
MSASAWTVEAKPFWTARRTNQHCAVRREPMRHIVRVSDLANNPPPTPRPPLPEMPPRDLHGIHVWSRNGFVFPAPTFFAVGSQ